jgi:hypothetical protein
MQIALRPTTLLDSVDMFNFSRELAKGRSPATVATYVSFLTVALRTAKGLGFIIEIKEIEAARHTMSKLGLIGSSRERDRRPTLPELNLLMQHFFDQYVRDPTSYRCTES